MRISDWSSDVCSSDLRRHEEADGLLVDDDVADLVGLTGDEAAPDSVALRPEVLAFVVEALGMGVHHDAERDAVDASADAAVVLRRPALDGDRVALLRNGHMVDTLVELLLQRSEERHVGNKVFSTCR